MTMSPHDIEVNNLISRAQHYYQWNAKHFKQPVASGATFMSSYALFHVFSLITTPRGQYIMILKINLTVSQH